VVAQIVEVQVVELGLGDRVLENSHCDVNLIYEIH